MALILSYQSHRVLLFAECPSRDQHVRDRPIPWKQVGAYRESGGRRVPPFREGKLRASGNSGCWPSLSGTQLGLARPVTSGSHRDGCEVISFHLKKKKMEVSVVSVGRSVVCADISYFLSGQVIMRGDGPQEVCRNHVRRGAVDGIREGTVVRRTQSHGHVLLDGAPLT
jgi:hypothetical protein